MDSGAENLCSVIQYYKGPETDNKNTNATVTETYKTQNSVNNINEDFIKIKDNNSLSAKEETNICVSEDVSTNENPDIIVNKTENFNGKTEEMKLCEEKSDTNLKLNNEDLIKFDHAEKPKVEKPELKSEPVFGSAVETDNDNKNYVHEVNKNESSISKKEEEVREEKFEIRKNEFETPCKGKKRSLSEVNTDGDSITASVEEVENNEYGLETELDEEDDDDEDSESKPRRRGRCKKNPDIIPSHLSSDMVLGYKILLKFLETPQFSGFLKPFKKSPEAEENNKITCLNQIKKKFEENSYKKVSEFVNDVREMLINIYESRNQVAIKKALRLEQILEQRIAQLPNYLRPQCALILSSDEVNNSHNKIRITKGGGFVSLLLEKTEKKRYEKNREKRKLLAEERKQMKEEQDKDVQEWEKNVLLKDFEEDIKSMWELPAIGHFIHLCADIFNIGEIAQFEVERMLLMPQCSETLDLIMTALLTNSLMRAKLDRTPSMPYSIWGPLVRTRVLSWYRMWHRDGRNEQKIFEEIGIEPDFWKILGPDFNPLDYYYFHEISLFQRVWILKTLCDVDFVRKKTVYDNVRAQTLDELNPVHLGLDQQGNRYIQFKQFCGSDIRIYRQSTKIEGDLTPSDLIESYEGFEYREGPIVPEKVFRDIWELNEKPEVKQKKKKPGRKKVKNFNAKVNLVVREKRNLRQSAREKQKTYADWSDSDQSDTDLRTLRNKLLKCDTDTLYRPFSDKEFISLSVFRLPRDKVNKPTPKRSSYVSRKIEESSKSDCDKNVKAESEDKKEDNKASACDDEQSDSLDAKQTNSTENFQGDDMNEDEFNLGERISNCELEAGDVNFTVKNLENLKMVLKKGSTPAAEESTETNISASSTADNSKSEETTGSREKEYDALYKYNVPNHLKPDSSKFYLVVDSVEGLRQLISKFGSHENDLEIISRSTKNKKRSTGHGNTSSEVQLIEKLQNLLLELEPWEIDLIKSSRSNREKMYKEYMNFINRPPDFVHPNESYWMKTYEEPTTTTSTAASTTTAVVTTTSTVSSDSNVSNTDKSGKESTVNTKETTDTPQQDSADTISLRKRNRVTRIQLQPDSDDLDEDIDDDDECESNESDDNWVLPTPKKRSRKETPKLPKRASCKKMKTSTVDKTEAPTNSGEKSQGSSPEKAKKALFWGPRSSDPSEDLNWETNRQKILEQHNSPVKKVLKPGDIVSNSSDTDSKLESILKSEGPSQSVIMTSPHRFTTSIPGNKKPYFSSAQLKAMESQAKKTQLEESQQKTLGAKLINKPEVKNVGSNTLSDFPVLNDRLKAGKIQSYSRVKKTIPAQPGVSDSQTITKLLQSPVRQENIVSTPMTSQGVRLRPQIVSSISGATQTLTNQIQSQQSGLQVQSIQIQDLGQNKTISSAANVKLQQSVQWQPKVISVQSVNQSGKVVQQQVLTQVSTQNVIQPQQPVSQNQVQLQVQGQSTSRVESQKPNPAQPSGQTPAEKLGNFLQMVASQGQGPLNLGGDLFITDGKNLMKFDNNFVQQLQEDKIVSLDLKKTLLLVRPKTDSDPSTSQTQTSVPQSQQSILVINKPAAVQQTSTTTSAPNYVIPSNYIIKDNNSQTQTDQVQPTVKIVQQTPTYVVQQKPITGKTLHPQVIKIITSQPVANSQNLILTTMSGQVIQPINQSAVISEQQTQQNKAPTTLRLVRPQGTSSTNVTLSKINSEQNPMIVNNVVQIQGQKLEEPKPQAGRIMSTGVPTVRMSAPQTVVQTTQAQKPVKTVTSAQPQTQTVLTTAQLPQGIRANVIAQPIRLAAIPQGQVRPQTVASNQNPRFVVSSTPVVRMAAATSSQLQTASNISQTHILRPVTSTQLTPSSISNTQILKPVGLNTQQVRLATAQPITVIQASNMGSQILRPTTVRFVSQPQLVQTQTLVTSNAGTQIAGSTSNLNTQSVKILQSPQFQTQTVVPCVSLNSQTVRLAGVSSQQIRLVQAQPARLVANNSAGVKLINKGATPVKAAIVTSAAQTQAVGVSNIRSPGVVCQPVRYQTVVQSSSVRPLQNKMQLVSPKKTVNSNTLTNTPILIVKEDDEEIRIVQENISEAPVTLDYINGELSVKKTTQGWKYAVKASNGKDIILTDEQIEERLKANNGVMK